MNVVVVTARTDPLVELATAKAHLRIEHDDDDDLIELYIEAVASWLDGPAGWLNRCLGPQTLSVELPAPKADGEIAIPYGPVTSITSITFLSTEGADVVAAAETYELIANRARLVAGSEWPAAAIGPVTVVYEAGHAVGALPGAIRSAMLLMVGDLYGQRETVSSGAGSGEARMVATAERLLAPWRLWHA